MLYTFCNYVARKNSNFPIFIKFAFQNFLDKRTLRRRAVSFQGYDDFYKILLHLPGFVYIEISTQKVQDDGFAFKFNNDFAFIKNIIWIMPWALEVINYMHYLQIDASFYALKPYKFCIYHSIYFNSSFPFALSIGPKENRFLYNLLFDGLNKFCLNKNVFENKVVLSDLGSPIKKFCKLHSNIQYFCHRHIIQIFGPKSSLGIWVARLLRCKTYLIYKQEKEFILVEMDEYKKDPNSPLFDDTDQDNEKKQKLKDFEIMLKDIDEVERMPNKEEIKKSDYYIANWAIWIRSDHHVARCSNHSEGFHGNINQKLPDSGTHSFKTGFTTIVNYLLNYINNYSDICGNSFQNKHQKMIQKVIQILSKRPDNYLKCSKENCDCGEDDFVESIYGVKLPCIHTILNNFCKSEIFNIVKNSNEIDIQYLFVQSLKKFPNYKFEKNLFKSNRKNIDRIISIYEVEKNRKFDKESLNILGSFINEFLNCFTYVLPKFPNINPNDAKYSGNHFDFRALDEKLVFRKKKEESNTSQKKEKLKLENLYDEDDNFDSMIKDCNADIELIKKKYYETKAEIKGMYPQLSYHDIEKICFSNFVRYVFETRCDNSGVIYFLSKFKIASWKNADLAAGGNRFFS